MAKDETPPGTEPKKARTNKEILEEARERLKFCIDENSELRRKQKDDLLFSTLEQWPADIRGQREGDPNGPRPCLTIDQINQYIVQVVNDMRQNRPSVKARPVDDQADIETAEVFQGIIRQIEDQSVAQIPYMGAGESAVRVGEGYFRFVTEYEDETSFNQVIRVKRVPDMFCCYLGPHVLPTGADAEYGFIFEDLPLQNFRRKWPKAKYHSTDFDELDDLKQYWGEDEKVRVAEYFYLDFEKDELLFLADGQTILRKEYEQLSGAPEIVDSRETVKRSVKWCKLTGVEILEKRDWAGKYIPIVKVTGKESWVDGRRITWGLVRPAKDSLRMYNYWSSAITEKLALSPKSPFIGAKGQFEGLEERWSQANRMNYAYLEYNPVSVDGLSVPPPQRQMPAPIEVAMIQQLQIIREDVQASLGMFRASLGKEQPNQSGKAILALTRESDTGTFHFADNLSLSIQHGGKILVDLIPKIYDTRRIMKILGEDGKVTTAEINPEQDVSRQQFRDPAGKIRNIYNLGVGEYDVTVTVGPSYNTKRMEAATLFTDLANSAKDPVSATVVRYLAIKNSDFAGAEQAAEMMEKLLPPGIVKKEGEPQIPPEVQGQMMQMQQIIQAQGQKLQELESGARVDMAKVQSQAQADQAKIASDHDAKMKQLALDAEIQQKELELARQKAEAEIQIKLLVADADAKIDKDKLDFEIACKKEEHESDLQMKQKEQSEDIMPQFVKALTDITQAFEGAMKENSETTKALLEASLAPKQITLQKSNGNITGALVRPSRLN